MGDIGFSELVAIAIIAILLYGKELPAAARKIAGLYTKFRRQLTDIKDELRQQIPEEEIRSLSNLESGPGAEPPQPPLGLSASPTPEQVQLTWMSSLGATSYTVKRSAGANEPYLVIAMYLTDLAYTDSDIQAGKTYHYAITAANTAGESGDSVECVTTVPGGEVAPTASAEPAPPPAAPSAPPAPEPPPGPAPAGGI